MSKLDEKVTALESEVEALREAIDADSLNGEAIEECRAMLADIGIEATFFTDCVAAAVQEIKARRYDEGRWRATLESSIRLRMRMGSTKPAPKRPKGSEKVPESLLIGGANEWKVQDPDFAVTS